jgi:glycosyltransferase involved in cell wall biosynthesis
VSRPTVLVNLTWLVPGVVGGSEESTTDALRAVVAADPTDLDLRLAVLRPFGAAHPDLAAALPCEVLDLDGHDKLRRVVAEQTWLAATTRRVGATAVHHAGGVVPLVHPGATVLTVHDLQPLDLAQNFSFAKRSYVRAMAGRSARAARVVCVPSEFTRGRVVELLGVDPAAVVVVPWSAPARRTGTGGSSSATSGDASFRPPAGPFFLYPAITYAHKNHLVLLEAFAEVAATDREVSLVLTGGAGPLEQLVGERVRQLGLSERVLRPGRVGEEQLEQLYDRATAVVVPSRYEGFGLPALEAMARGVPVLAARAGSLPEVVPPEALLDPDDVTAWAGAMQAVLQLRDDERDDRIAVGRAAAAAFSPGRTAEALLGAYRRALTAGPGNPRP